GKKLERRIALNFHIPVPPELKSYPKNIPKTGGVKKLHLQKYAIEIIITRVCRWLCTFNSNPTTTSFSTALEHSTD
ncbi:MAG: hypothetical protein IKR15_05570, partial [Bacteroidales bacterium]|nr:hypothetical protein [Bacteroidales bacterium]